MGVYCGEMRSKPGKNERMSFRVKRLLIGVAAMAALAVMLPSTPVDAQSDPAPMVTEDFRLTMSDGVEVLVRLGGRGPLVDGHLPERPFIAEFTPYGPGCCAELAGPEFNYLQVHIRGTGLSNGQFDALGPRSQADMVEVLDWACQQPWSNGTAGLWGFSASAIMVYNSLHAELPCVESAVLGAGTHELYRDLMYPGGIPNGLPALGVFALIGAPALASLPDRLANDPLSVVDFATGMGVLAANYLAHPTLDSWWRQRGMRGNANDFPVLMITGFFDVESRGPFEAFAELKPHGAHLYVVGAHDGIPVGSGGADIPRSRWFQRYLLGDDNGIDTEPVVQAWLADGDRVDMLNGDFVTRSGDTWPLADTDWTTLHLDPARSGTAATLNDGTLALVAPEESLSVHLPIPSLATATDPYTTSLLGVFNDAEPLINMDLPETLGQSYTTGPLADDVTLIGPAAAELVVTNTTPETDLYAVISDVWPDGSVHPMSAGRLRTAYPNIVEDRSLIVDGEVVRPYNDLSRKSKTLLTEHRYHVEFWPIGNRFKAGHRIRVHLVGASLFHLSGIPGPQLVRLGGDDGGSLLRVPVAPGDDLIGALGGSATTANLAGETAAAPTEGPTAVQAAAADLEGLGAGTGQRLPATGGDNVLMLAGLFAVSVALVGRSRIRPTRR